MSKCSFKTGKASLDLGQPKVVKGLITLKCSSKMAGELVIGEKIMTKKRGEV
jgi:hypothetical protein